MLGLRRHIFPEGTSPPSNELVVVMTTSKTTVDFWFDPLCPWAWITSRWILEAQNSRSLDIRWHVMSLIELNKDIPDLPESYVQGISKGAGQLRVIAAAQKEFGDSVLLPMYTALGERIHNEKRGVEDENIVEALAAAGLPARPGTCHPRSPRKGPLEASRRRGRGARPPREGRS